MKRIHIDETHVGERVDTFLARTLEQSRSSIQKLIKAGSVFLNNTPAKTNARLEQNDVIEVPELDRAHKPTKKTNTPLLHIVYEDDDLMVINKPAGLLVHPVMDHTDEPTVVDALLEHDPAIAEVGEDPKRPGIVHRLDKDVSGLMVIAKTPTAYQHLKTQFQKRTVKKEYLALVYGNLPKDHDVITLKIGRSKTRGRMVARPVSQEGKEALTEYEVVKRFKNHTFVRVAIHTGRTHQIRVHLRAIDHPLVGDELYKKSRMKHIRPIKLSRIFLHASKLTVQLMNGKKRTFEEPLPDELTSLLNML